jgi:hypothetical protein
VQNRQLLAKQKNGRQTGRPPHAPPKKTANRFPCICSTTHPPKTTPPFTQAFLKVYATLRDELLDDALLAGQPAPAKEWLREMLDYNVPGGKLNRGMAVYDVLAAIRGADGVSAEDAFRANALGWCIELLQAFFLVADDIMDGSVTRRGQPCWYRVDKVGLGRVLRGVLRGVFERVGMLVTKCCVLVAARARCNGL